MFFISANYDKSAASVCQQAPIWLATVDTFGRKIRIFDNFEHLRIVYIRKVCIAKLPAIATLAELAKTFLGDMTQIGTLLLGVTPLPP